jgi:hypothetical protein
MIKFFARDPTC